MEGRCGSKRGSDICLRCRSSILAGNCVRWCIERIIVKEHWLDESGRRISDHCSAAIALDGVRGHVKWIAL